MHLELESCIGIAFGCSSIDAGVDTFCQPCYQDWWCDPVVRCCMDVWGEQLPFCSVDVALNTSQFVVASGVFTATSLLFPAKETFLDENAFQASERPSLDEQEKSHIP